MNHPHPSPVHLMGDLRLHHQCVRDEVESGERVREWVTDFIPPGSGGLVLGQGRRVRGKKGRSIMGRTWVPRGELVRGVR